MRTIKLRELRKIPLAGEYIDWVLPWQEEALLNCFKFLTLELKLYEKFNSDGGACLLVKGAGKIGEQEILPNMAFGITPDEVERFISIPEWFQASEECIVLCVNTNIFHNVCFGMGCAAMHARVRQLLITGFENRTK